DENSDIADGDFSPGHLSLREAVNLSNANPGPDTITFNLGGAATIHLANFIRFLDTNGPTTILGGGLITIADNFLEATLGTTLTLDGLTVTGSQSHGVINVGTMT